MTQDQEIERSIEEKVAELRDKMTSIKVKEGATKSPQLHDPNVPSTEFVDVPDLDVKLLRDVLTDFGANFNDIPERSAALKTLYKQTNAGRKDGMDAVWGKKFMDAFKRWTTNWTDNYEERTGKRLPTVKTPSGKKVKTSGVRQVFSEMTAYVYGAMDEETFKLHIAGRVLNGELSSQKKEKKSLKREGHNENIGMPASIPPGFIPDLWNALESGEFKVDDEQQQ